MRKSRGSNRCRQRAYTICRTQRRCRREEVLRTQRLPLKIQIASWFPRPKNQVLQTSAVAKPGRESAPSRRRLRIRSPPYHKHWHALVREQNPASAYPRGEARCKDDAWHAIVWRLRSIPTTENRSPIKQKICFCREALTAPPPAAEILPIPFASHSSPPLKSKSNLLLRPWRRLRYAAIFARRKICQKTTCIRPPRNEYTPSPLRLFAASSQIRSARPTACAYSPHSLWPQWQPLIPPHRRR